MDYKYKEYVVETNKQMELEETKIITLGDLNWNHSLSKYQMDDLIVRINDIIPNYLFILGNITDYNTLQNILFQEKLAYFFELLSYITKTYIVFGKNDYETDKDDEKYATIDKLLAIYNKYPVSILNNDCLFDSSINIVGLNINPNIHCNTNDKKKKIEDLINKINNLINNNIYTLLLTHTDISALKNDKELLSYFDLILTKSYSPISKPSMFPKRENDNLFHKFIIENGGIHQKEEMDFIKIIKK